MPRTPEPTPAPRGAEASASLARLTGGCSGGRLGRCPTASAAATTTSSSRSRASARGPAPAGQPAHVAQVLAAQRGAGNAMVTRAVVTQRAPAQQIQSSWIGDIINMAKKNAGMPYVADIGGEKVQVTDASRRRRSSAPSASSRTARARNREITSASKVDQSITKNTASGELDDATLGEFFRDSKNFALFTPGETSDIDFPGDVDKQLEATTVHEIAHGLMKYAEADFMKETGYWSDRSTKSGTAGAEAPPTKYGDKNAGEDLSESTMFFFVDRERLKNGDGSASAGDSGDPCPKRFSFLERIVGDWKPPVGDFPVPDPKADTALA
jgi:hypothetical protein